MHVDHDRCSRLHFGHSVYTKNIRMNPCENEIPLFKCNLRFQYPLCHHGDQVALSSSFRVVIVFLLTHTFRYHMRAASMRESFRPFVYHHHIMFQAPIDIVLFLSLFFIVSFPHHHHHHSFPFTTDVNNYGYYNHSTTST